MIQTEQLTRHFKDHVAVDNISLTIERGEVFGFLGPNGSGKTTTIAMLLGLIKPTSGRARIMGHDVQENPVAALSHVGAMIESPAFYPYLSGYNNLRILARADGLPASRIDAVLEMVELQKAARDRFQTYSQGMKQRLAIAAALLREPEIIILDEPTNGLDPAGMVEIRSLIRQLVNEGHTIFLSSHLLYEVEQTCHRVAILKEGRILAEGAVDALLHRGRGVQVRVTGDVQKAIEVLQAVPWIESVKQEADLLLIDVASDQAPQINALLTQAGILVAEIRAREETLETFFLEVTGGS
ncbi:MAG: ABC transporter ATP-binding protein [Chloroflexaceae bacterium]|nr:ABC transporter ATP-binding protein [Chloroflexaceae bacterium]